MSSPRDLLTSGVDRRAADVGPRTVRQHEGAEGALWEDLATWHRALQQVRDFSISIT